MAKYLGVSVSTTLQVLCGIAIRSKQGEVTLGLQANKYLHLRG